MPFIPPDLAAFLVEAKRRTYAGLDDDATIATPRLEAARAPRAIGFTASRRLRGTMVHRFMSCVMVAACCDR
ncbi:hypothetical protein [Bradyrhizobium vignae]|uniref:hypothetical protein n=1 Tax=Bradyrhizobium vignae TaxID=1549949 RepID=UPI001FD7C53D|nr:hypothetical protein [Bradyrhizobium vignae]